MATDFHVKRNKALHIRLFIISLLGAVISIFYYLERLSDTSLFLMMLTSIIAIFFIFVIFTSSKMLINRKPALSLTTNGLIDSVSLASAGEVPWKEIKSVKFEHYINSDQILIALHNPEKIMEKLSFMKRKMVNQQLVDTGAVIVINPKMIQGKPQDIVNKIKRRAKV